jgi:excisionase family DNA binding protein
MSPVKPLRSFLALDARPTLGRRGAALLPARLRPEPPTSDPAQAGDGLLRAFDACVGHLLGSAALETILGGIRTIVREEISQAPFADRLLDVAEAAERLGISEAALRKAAARGTVPVQHVGRRLRFRLSELLSQAEQRRPGT